MITTFASVQFIQAGGQARDVGTRQYGDFVCPECTPQPRRRARAGCGLAGLPAALGRYEQERLPLARGLVSSGTAWGRSRLSTV
jgi:hypothetical protein